MADLLELVDTLTKPRIEHVAQRTDAGEWVRTCAVEHPALFVQLQDAGSGRTSAGSNHAKHERAIVDLDALFLHTDYTGQVVAWCRDRNVTPTRNPVTDLRAWYADTLADNTFDPYEYRITLGRWVHTIREHFDPPKKFEADYPCPICGADVFGDAINGGGKAIEITYRLDDDGRPHGERALCRLCRTVWVGHDSLMELAEEQFEKKSA